MNTNPEPLGEPSAASAHNRSSRILLIRHGRTHLNAAGLLRGHLDPPLDEVGRAEAGRLGKALAKDEIRLVVASPLLRAVQTAKAIAAPHGIEVTVDERLVDRDYGAWAGHAKREVEAKHGTLDNAPGVEPLADVTERAIKAVEELALRSVGTSTVAVTHDVVLRQVLVALCPNLGDPEGIAQHTGCLNSLVYRDGAWSVESLNVVPDDDPAPGEADKR